MTNVVSFFLIVLIGLIMFIMGREYEDGYTLGILGGFIVFMMGLGILFSPLADLSELMNLSVGSALFGVGAWIWIMGSIQLLKDKGVIG
jgi:hypothetical protein